MIRRRRSDYTNKADLKDLQYKDFRWIDLCKVFCLPLFNQFFRGVISLNNNVGVDVGAIFLKPTETGTKLTIIYERRLAFFEVRAGTRSANYQFGYLEIYLDRNGKGEGTMIPAARIRLQKDGSWEVEDFGEFPARLLGVQVRQ